MRYSTIFLDLDGTMYPAENGIWDALSERINKYMLALPDIDPDEVPVLRQRYYSEYGTTLRGLIVHHKIDPEEYLEFVHSVPIEDFLELDADLISMFENLSQNIWILTNSYRRHAKRVLKTLGVWRYFQGVIDVNTMDFRNKPDPFVYEKSLEIAGGLDPSKCIFVDDIPKNLIPAHDLGLTTVLVGAQQKNERSDYHIDKIHDLAQTIPELHPTK